jgi:hypothetical protein
MYAFRSVAALTWLKCVSNSAIDRNTTIILCWLIMIAGAAGTDASGVVFQLVGVGSSSSSISGEGFLALCARVQIAGITGGRRAHKLNNSASSVVMWSSAES